MIFYICSSLALAALTPWALLVTRDELRKVRIGFIEDLRRTLFHGDANLPQIALVSARYCENGRNGAPSGRQGKLRLWAGAIIFFIVSLGGFLILLTPRQWLLSEGPAFGRLTYALLWTTERSLVADLAQAVTIAGVAFLGGYVFQLRYLIRTTLNQELSALAFVRASLHIFQGVIIAIVLYRTAGTAAGLGCQGAECPTTLLTGAGPAAAAQPAMRDFAAALGIAFLVGYWPDLGLARIGKLLRVRAKYVDTDALEQARIVPLEVIDGIDAETAFRLQESNLHDVQNLATANPIQLYVETPFGLLEILDWVLQAQLCENVGPETFNSLRRIGIRTVFDLERAVLACDAPPEHVVAIGAILLARADAPFFDRAGLKPAGDGTAPGITLAIVRHIVAVILDDLHIHQLRALWRIMLRVTQGEESRWLHPTGPLPGEPDLPACP